MTLSLPRCRFRQIGFGANAFGGFGHLAGNLPRLSKGIGLKVRRSSATSDFFVVPESVELSRLSIVYLSCLNRLGARDIVRFS
jgi:hypothetical protein